MLPRSVNQTKHQRARTMTGCKEPGDVTKREREGWEVVWKVGKKPRERLGIEQGDVWVSEGGLEREGTG